MCRGKTMQSFIYLLVIAFSVVCTACIQVDIQPATPTPKPKKQTRVGATFIRGGIVVSRVGTSLEPLRKKAARPGVPIPFGDGAVVPDFFPVHWHAGQRFLGTLGEAQFMAAAPLQPNLYPLLEQGFEGGTTKRGLVAFDRQGRLFAALHPDGNVYAHALPTGERLGNWTWMGELPTKIQILAPKQRLITVQPHHIEARSLSAGDLQWQWPTRGKKGRRMVDIWNPDGQRLRILSSQGKRGGFCVSTLNSDGALEGEHCVKGGRLGLYDHHDGVLVALIEEKGRPFLIHLDIETGLHHKLAVDWHNPPAFLELSKDGQALYLAEKSGGGQIFEIQKAKAGQKGAFTPGPRLESQGDIWAVAASPRGLYQLEGAKNTRLVALNWQGERLWQGKAPEARALKLSQDGRYVIAHGVGGTSYAARTVSIFDQDQPGSLSAKSHIQYQVRGVIEADAEISRAGLWMAVWEAPRLYDGDKSLGAHRLWLLR